MFIYRTSQAKCLFDHGQIDPKLDHGAELILPGERFDADQQCIQKSNSIHSEYFAVVSFPILFFVDF